MCECDVIENVNWLKARPKYLHWQFMASNKLMKFNLNLKQMTARTFTTKLNY